MPSPGPTAQDPARPGPRGGERAPAALRPWHAGAFALVALLLLAVLALLALAVPSIVAGFRHGLPLYVLTRPPAGKLAPDRARLHLDVVGLDPWAGTLTLRVAGTHTCRVACPWSDRLTFVATQHNQPGLEGLPPAVVLPLPPAATAVAETVVAETVTLPIEGAPLDYPFDRYRLVLGLLYEQVPPDGRARALSPAEAGQHLTLALRNHVPGTVMDRPAALDPTAFAIPDSPDRYALVVALGFRRPAYAQILAVLLVLLAGAAAAYAVLSRPLADLLVHAGALVLGVWGVRALLVGPALPGTTGLDLALSLVILFLLGGVAARVLHDLDRRSGLHLLRRRPRDDGTEAAGSGDPPPPGGPPRGERR